MTENKSADPTADDKRIFRKDRVRSLYGRFAYVGTPDCPREQDIGRKVRSMDASICDMLSAISLAKIARDPASLLRWPLAQDALRFGIRYTCQEIGGPEFAQTVIERTREGISLEDANIVLSAAIAYRDTLQDGYPYALVW